MRRLRIFMCEASYASSVQLVCPPPPLRGEGGASLTGKQRPSRGVGFLYERTIRADYRFAPIYIRAYLASGIVWSAPSYLCRICVVFVRLPP